MPLVPALSERQRPIEQVAEVSEDLSRSSRGFANAKGRETIGRAAKSFGRAVSERGDGVAQELTAGFRNDRFGFVFHARDFNTHERKVMWLRMPRTSPRSQSARYFLNGK